MKSTDKQLVSIETTVKAPVEKVWRLWTTPEHITNWYYASDEWHAPKAENDLCNGGRFLTRMEAKDGSFGFDFEGVYDEVQMNTRIAYTLGDGRTVETCFIAGEIETKVFQTFEAETQNSIEMQRTGWQAILNNFRKYAEAN